MTADEAKSVLHSAFKPLVLAALSYVNLQDKELDVLILRHMRGKTQEKIAEEMGCSVNGLQKIEYRAIEKCCEVWDKLYFVQEMLRM